MDALLKNAVDSIRVGVEDYETGKRARVLSAVRNLHAGLLLLAKWILVRSVPNSRDDHVIAVAYQPEPDGVGGVKYVPSGPQTIGLRDIPDRLGKFDLDLSVKARKRLESLAKVRNAVEHRYPDAAGESLHQTVSEAFVVAAEFLRLGRLDPVGLLGKAWDVMLNVNEVHEQELAECRATWRDVAWGFDVDDDVGPQCPVCGSELLKQLERDNKEHDSVRGKCLSCGEELDAETFVECLLGAQYWANGYLAAKGRAHGVLHDCPSCALRTYVDELGSGGEVTGCVVCGFTLGVCCICTSTLMPDDLFGDREDLCGTCGHRIDKARD